jgi:hypothetical protein
MSKYMMSKYMDATAGETPTLRPGLYKSCNPVWGLFV